MSSLKGLFRRLRYERGFAPADMTRFRPTAPTLHASTVFAGEAAEWIRYLDTGRERRYDSPVKINIQLAARELAFSGDNEPSSTLAWHLTKSFSELQDVIRRKPFVHTEFNQGVLENHDNIGSELILRASSILPCDASREVELDHSPRPRTVLIVLSESLIRRVLRNLAAAGSDLTAEEHLGLCWPLTSCVLSQLSCPNNPRDRFVQKIETTFRGCLVMVNVLYEGRRRQCLVPNQMGKLFEEYMARRDGIPRAELFDRHPLFQLLNDLAFMLNESSCRANLPFAKVMVREYLDDRYLRLSLAGVMPELDDVLTPMPYHQQKAKVLTPHPRLHRFGILDEDDLKAWKKVEGPFSEMGFTLIRQLGIGQFARVYEACNPFNPHIPRHVALKIDRIVRGKKKEAIQSAEATMRIGEDLSAAPHVIRVFDAGKLKGKRYTYHVLQMVDGDTLDNLVGITGIEHSSMLPPRAGTRSVREVQQDYFKTIKRSAREAWRRHRMGRPFVAPLDLSQVLDLLTSILLWLEEIHQLDYAVNDLKNGNLMVSRRGQLKGIDLDSYCFTQDPMGRVTDFFFLAVSLTLLLLNINRFRGEPMTGCEGLLKSRHALLGALHVAWPFGNVADLSNGRVETGETIELLADLIERSRNHSFAHDPDLFSRDIDRLVMLKRAIFSSEIVLD